MLTESWLHNYVVPVLQARLAQLHREAVVPDHVLSAFTCRDHKVILLVNATALLGGFLGTVAISVSPGRWSRRERRKERADAPFQKQYMWCRCDTVYLYSRGACKTLQTLHLQNVANVYKTLPTLHLPKRCNYDQQHLRQQHQHNVVRHKVIMNILQRLS